jgi:hypothetical protein
LSEKSEWSRNIGCTSRHAPVAGGRWMRIPWLRFARTWSRSFETRCGKHWR